jgi:hypothetical protein
MLLCFYECKYIKNKYVTFVKYIFFILKMILYVGKFYGKMLYGVIWKMLSFKIIAV